MEGTQFSMFGSMIRLLMNLRKFARERSTSILILHYWYMFPNPSEFEGAVCSSSLGHVLKTRRIRDLEINIKKRSVIPR